MSLELTTAEETQRMSVSQATRARTIMNLEIGDKNPQQSCSKLHHIDHWSDGPVTAQWGEIIKSQVQGKHTTGL
jgi:hypothetical protein